MTEAIQKHIPKGNYYPKYKTMKSALRALGYPADKDRNFGSIDELTEDEIKAWSKKALREISLKYHPDVIGIDSLFYRNILTAYGRVEHLLARGWKPKSEKQGGWDAFYMTEQGGYNG